jgi:hypothetical protein
MSDNKLSAREAALLAQARAELGRKSAQQPAAAADAAAPSDAVDDPALNRATPAPVADPVERIAALLAAARAESEGRRQLQRRMYVWAPVAFVSVIGLSTLLWLWHRL